MTVPALVVIYKVRVENLQSPGPSGWGSRRLKVKFRAGSAAKETRPKKPSPDGSIEWTEPLEMRVHDTEENLKATVVSRLGDTGAWSFVPNARFVGFPVKVLPAVWTSGSGAGPTFRAELATFTEGAAQAAPASLENVDEHEGIQYFPAAAGGDTYTGVLQQQEAQRITSGAGRSGGGLPGWVPAAGAAAVAGPIPPLGYNLSLPVSTAVPVADAATAPGTARAAGAARGGSLFTTPSARRHSSLVERSSSAGFLNRDGSIPGRSREGSSSSFRMARGSSRSLGQSQGESSSSHDSGPPPLPSPVGTPSLSRLMDDNYRLEENGVSVGLPPPAVPSERVWGGPALQQASAPGAQPAFWDATQSAEVEGSARTGRTDSTGHAQREDPSIDFSGAYDAGDSPDAKSEPKHKGTGFFWRLPWKKTKKPPAQTPPPSWSASGARDEPGTGGRATYHSENVVSYDDASGEPIPSPSPRPVTRVHPASGLRRDLISARTTGSMAPSRGPIRMPRGRRLMAVDPRDAAAPEDLAVADPRSPGAMAAALPAPTAPPLPPPTAPPPYGGSVDGYGDSLVRDSLVRDQEFAIPLRLPSAIVGQQAVQARQQQHVQAGQQQQQMAVQQGMAAAAATATVGALRDTARAESPPPSYEFMSMGGLLDSRVHAPAILGRAQPGEEAVLEQEAKEARGEVPIYDHPIALGPRLEDGGAWESQEDLAIPDRGIAPRSAVHGPDTSEGRTFYPEGSIPQGEELLFVRRGMGSGGGGAPHPRPRARRSSSTTAESPLDTPAVQPLGRLEDRGHTRPEEEEAGLEKEAAEGMMEASPTYDHPVALGPRRVEDGDVWENEDDFLAVPDRGIAPPSAVHGPDTSEGHTLYPEGSMLQGEETERMGSEEGGAPPPPRLPPLRTLGLALPTPAVQPLGRPEDRGRTQPEEEEAGSEEDATEGVAEASPTYDHPVALGSRRLEDEVESEDEAGYSAMPSSARSLGHGPNGIYPKEITPRNGGTEGGTPPREMLLREAMWKLEDRARRVPSVPRSFSVRTEEAAPQVRRVQPLGREILDDVCFSCFSPRAVWAGHEFQLNILAYLPQLRDDILQAALSKGEVEAGLPEGMSILRGKEVTVKLDLPDNIFKALGPERSGSSHPPSVRDFVWNGNVEAAGFTVECLRHAAVGVAQCVAHIIEGSRVTRLSFGIEVVETAEAWAYEDTKADLLNTKTEQVEADVAVIDPNELEVFDLVIGHGNQGETFKGRWRGKDVAVKRLKQPSAVSGLRHEATILSLLGQHPNIVEFYGLSKRGGGNGDEGLDVVTKFEEGGTLQAALGVEMFGTGRTNGGGRKVGKGWQFSGLDRTAWARDVARGLANSHSVGVVHNDVACRNALRSSTDVGAPVLLCDFGMSRILRGDGVERASLIDLQRSRDKWPVWQMPKESLSFPYTLSQSSDTWMYGALLYEIFEGKRPFCGIGNSEVKRLILEGKTLDTPVLLKEQGLEDVFRSCLEVDWTKRPSMDEVVTVLSY